ncbi:D-alanyl-D-alanine carboxypeptidase/D-alanyl-D-alanine-endopeptidase [Deinococcus yavapaiensis]|uniref:D-alanyl-D-alanine carboxypeptidase/D-alanyl-D-alanine-endopeptidase (Penicillin-binding protein 4) n=1 Tax=Deinococcus yavapaiensis KR-236 TaxID=694435 RepID=A0A318S7K4_9DEIO|nr:D-alanyl-D-alanine carboxypeptidase [Deinococcus yavapaiensis]PYE53768.1 D-alanyl-D-alanine carboxypeptidase/D-alanyl-D-alanine-endopeptidase (penicillin-binding protein 4) [Deinococcus yavapaiensis KR-236]
MHSRILILALALLATATAASPPAAVQAILARGPLPSPGQKVRAVHVGVLVQDLSTDERLIDVRANESFQPASNTKLATAAALLYALGPRVQLETRLLARGADTGVTRLTLVGSGDPTFTSSGPNSLASLARQVADAGVLEVGDLVIDDSLLARPWLLPDNGELVSAVRVGDLRPSSGAEPFTPSAPQRYASAVGEALRAALEDAGVRVTSAARQGQAAPDDTVIASVRSAPLSEVLARTLKPSDNAAAEHLLALTGVSEKGASVTPAQARASVAAFLDRAGVDRAGISLVDGSGLSRNDRLTPNAVVQLLRFAYRTPLLAPGETLTPLEAFKTHRNPFVEALAVGGTGTATSQAAANGGTLATRFVNAGLDVRAKTGTIVGASALSGYVVAKSGRVLAFSLLMDGYGGFGSELRAFQDELVKAIAGAY